jgi:cell division protein FtsB
MTARETRRNTSAEIGEETLLERLDIMTAEAQKIAKRNVFLERGLLPLVVTLVAALVIAVAGALYAGLQSLHQIQDTRFTRDDGAVERKERIDADDRLASRLTDLTIVVTKLAEQKTSNERALTRLEGGQVRLEAKLDNLTNEITKEFVRKNELPLRQ